MTTMASQITSLTVVYSTVYSDADQRKHQSSASPAFVWGNHRDRWIPRTKGPVTRKMFPFDDVIMWHSEIWTLCHPHDSVQCNASPKGLWPLDLSSGCLATLPKVIRMPWCKRIQGQWKNSPLATGFAAYSWCRWPYLTKGLAFYMDQNSFALNTSCEEYLQQSVCLILQICWKKLLSTMSQLILMNFFIYRLIHLICLGKWGAP